MARHPSIEKSARSGGVSAALRDWKGVALYAGITVLFFHRILLGEAWLWEDMMYFSYPVRVFAASSMALGHIPLWNPYTFSGMPFLADIQTTVLYIPCIALALFVRDGTLSFYWLELMVIAHYVLAGWAMYLLASSLDLKRAPALFAGAAYMLSGFMIAHAIHQQIITMVAWFPLVMMLFRAALAGGSSRAAFLCALVLGHSTLAGYPQLSLYFHVFLFAYFLFLLVDTYRGKALFSRPALMLVARAGMIVGLALAVAALQLLPTAELAGLSVRAQITYEKSTEGSLALGQLLTLFIPKLFGSAGAAGSTYWGPGTYWYFWETCIYTGVLPLLLAVTTLPLVRRTPHALFLWGVVLCSLMFALGNNFFFHKLVLDYVPGFSTFRDPARAGVFFSLAVALLAAFGLQALLAGEKDPALSRRVRTVILSTAGAGVLLWGAVVTGMLDPLLGVPESPAVRQAMTKEAHTGLLFLLCASGALIALRAGAAWRGRIVMVIPALFFVDMYVFGADQNASTVNPAEYFHRADPLVRFLRNDMKTDLFRVNTRNQFGMIMDRNQGMVDRIFTLEGYTPLVLTRAAAPMSDRQKFDLLNVKYRVSSERRAGTLSLVPNPTYMPRAYLMYDVRVARTEEEFAAVFRDSTWNHTTTAVLERDSPLHGVPPPGGRPGSVRVTAYDDNSVSIEAESPAEGILVLSEVFYPGWRATVDGTETEILRTDYNLRGIVFPPGRHRVEFRFMPPPFVTGAWITAAALCVCVAGIVIPFRRRQPLQVEGR